MQRSRFTFHASPEAANHPSDEVAKHLLGHLEVGDHAVTKRPRRANVGGSASDHPTRVLTDGLDLSGALVDRDHRRLEHDDAVAAPIDDGVRRAEIHRQLTRRSPPAQPDPTPNQPPHGSGYSREIR